MSRTSTATDGASPPGADPAGESGGRGGRSWTSRLSTGHAVMLLAGLIAAVANFAYLRGQSDRTEVLVAASDLRPGQVVTAEQLEPRRVQASDRVVAGLVRPGELDGELVAAGALPAGTPVRDADLRPVAADDDRRRMSVPVDAARAAGGRITAGDHVDVIHVDDGRARYVVGDAPVLAVDRTSDTAALRATGSFSITVAVTADGALCLARAIESGALDVVVATGQEPVEVDGCEPPAGAADEPDGGGTGPDPAPAAGDGESGS